MHYDKDYVLAQQLQEQYNRNSYNKGNDYKTPEKIKQKIGNLSSPTWELTDPNPNIHALFMQFDKQFFWNSLASVVVRWSKRMYSCAGICRYEGRGGFCDIALSEPLLKLRPRKDFIETLLHEMIHAYLFVTKSNRDRDGHGPDFHEHMYRINRAANINITVYHTFVEEVHFYQTHWWRCNGPCQSHKPFFGMVRRTCNRAPGPSDYWWARHQHLCGGQFLKIKEPEKNKKTKMTASKSPTKPVSKDIRDYFDSPKKLSNYPSSSKESGVKLNSIPKMPSIDAKSNTSIEPSSNNVRDAVRNHWLNKYSDNRKRGSDEDTDMNPRKILKSADSFKTDASRDRETTTSAPVKNPIPIDKLNDCKKILYDLYGESAITDSAISKLCENDNRMTNQKDDQSLSKCPICDAPVLMKNINTHLDGCLLTKEFTDNDFQKTSNVIDLTWNNEFKSPLVSENAVINLTGIEVTKPIEKFHNCPICNKVINANSTEDHLEECLNSTFKNESNEMPSCSDDTDLDLLLDNFDESDEYNASGTKIPCPCCYTLFEEREMNEHLDNCLI